MVYQKLIEEYETLSEKEKYALLVYKSRLGRAINAMQEDSREVSNIYTEYKKLMESPKNIFMKLTVFQMVSFESEEAFLKSLKNIQHIIEGAAGKLRLPADVTVYRAFSIPKDKSPIPLAKANFISTSLNMDQCLSFFIGNREYTHYFYEIHLTKGDPVLVIPYAILLNSKESQLTLSKKTDQEEILLSKENYTFEEEERNQRTLPNGEMIHIISIRAKSKKLQEEGIQRR